MGLRTLTDAAGDCVLVCSTTDMALGPVWTYDEELALTGVEQAEAFVEWLTEYGIQDDPRRLTPGQLGDEIARWRKGRVRVSR